MKPLLLFLLINLQLGNVSSVYDQFNLDSVKVRASLIQDKKSRIEYLNKLVHNLREIEPKEALELAIYTNKIARNFGDDGLFAQSSNNLGWIYYRLANYTESYKYSTEGYRISIKNKKYSELAASLNNLGAVYAQVNVIEEGTKSFKEAYFFSLKSGDNFTAIRSLNNLVNLFIQSDNLDSAQFYLIKSKKINSTIDSAYLDCFITRLEGDLLFRNENYNLALNKYLSALKIANDFNLKSFQGQLYHRIGDVYLTRGELLKSLEFLNKGVELCKKNEYLDELINTYRIIAITHENLGSIDQAFHFHKLYSTLKEEFQNQLDINKFSFVQGFFENEKAQINAQFFQAENKIKELKLENAERLMIFAVISILIFFGLLIWLSLLNRRLKAINIYLKAEREKLNLQKIELEQVSSNLQQVNRTKNLLFSILSHDLRNPVSQLKGIFELLQEDVISRDEFNEITKLLKRNVDGLYINLDNILIWSKSQLEGFKVKKSKIHFREIIDQSVVFYQSMAEDKGLKIFLSLNQEFIYTDPLLLQSVIRNLINNAIKYSPRNSEIVIETEKANKSIYLKITDKGKGFDPSIMNLILQDGFNLIESRLGTEKESGTGLGLNISKQLLCLIGGKLHISNSPHNGTIVSVVLPYLNSDPTL